QLRIYRNIQDFVIVAY
ncbi:tyrosine recombinase xerC domain protein, partial [Chlamydia psittaci 84-8471/1]